MCLLSAIFFHVTFFDFVRGRDDLFFDLVIDCDERVGPLNASVGVLDFDDAEGCVIWRVLASCDELDGADFRLHP